MLRNGLIRRHLPGAVDNGFGEFSGLVDASSRIDIAILLHGLGASFGIAKGGIHGTHNIPAKVQMEDEFPFFRQTVANDVFGK